jgi:hypothetical protein
MSPKVKSRQTGMPSAFEEKQSPHEFQRIECACSELLATPLGINQMHSAPAACNDITWLSV